MSFQIPQTLGTTDPSSVELISDRSESSSGHNGRRWEDLTKAVRAQGRSISDPIWHFSNTYLIVQLVQLTALFGIVFAITGMKDFMPPNYSHELSEIADSNVWIGHHIQEQKFSTKNQLETLIEVLTNIAAILNHTQCPQ